MNYRDEWTKKYEEDGIQASEEVFTKFHCRFCSKDYELDNNGESKIKRHISTDKHKKNKGEHHPTDKYKDQVSTFNRNRNTFITRNKLAI